MPKLITCRLNNILHPQVGRAIYVKDLANHVLLTYAIVQSPSTLQQKNLRKKSLKSCACRAPSAATIKQMLEQSPVEVSRSSWMCQTASEVAMRADIFFQIVRRPRDYGSARPGHSNNSLLYNYEKQI